MAWRQLVNMIDEALDIDRLDRTRPPTSCPADYTALRQGMSNKLFCPWCGLRWPDDAQVWGEFPGSF